MLKNSIAIVVAFPLAPMPRRAEVEKELLIGTKLTSCSPHGGGKCTYAPVSEGPHEPMVLDTFRNHYPPPPSLPLSQRARWRQGKGQVGLLLYLIVAAYRLSPYEFLSAHLLGHDFRFHYATSSNPPLSSPTVDLLTTPRRRPRARKGIAMPKIDIVDWKI